jgi:hypothetical protein
VQEIWKDDQIASPEVCAGGDEHGLVLQSSNGFSESVRSLITPDQGIEIFGRIDVIRTPFDCLSFVVLSPEGTSVTEPGLQSTEGPAWHGKCLAGFGITEVVTSKSRNGRIDAFARHTRVEHSL